MELRQLRYFVAIAEHANFTRASERLSIAQPALTAQMQKLEAELGAPLFIRAKRGITLTEVGQSLLGPARAALDAADGAKRVAQLTAGLEAARVKVAFSRTYPVEQLARIIRSFRRARPNVKLELQEMWSSDQEDAVASGAIDFGFRTLAAGAASVLAERDVVATRMSEESLTLAVYGSHRLAARRSVHLDELHDEPFIVTTARQEESLRSQIRSAMDGAGIATNIVQQTSDVRLSLALVSAELGITLVLSSNRNVRLRNLHYLTIAPAITVAFGVIYRRGYGGRAVEPLLEQFAREEVA